MKSKRVLLSIEEIELLVRCMDDWLLEGFSSDEEMLATAHELKNDLIMVINGTL